MIKLGDRTYVSYITGKRIKVIAIDDSTSKLYINDEYKGRCDLQFVLKRIKELEKAEQTSKWGFEDEKKLYSELKDILKSQIISSNTE